LFLLDPSHGFSPFPIWTFQLPYEHTREAASSFHGVRPFSGESVKDEGQ
jgi:hypothetical protein